MNANLNFPICQTHLDFHTSPDIPGIGSRFSKENFQKALKVGHLDSITVFAKCHHGLCYYPTQVGTMHPNLNFDLTGAMIEAAHEIGVRAPVYITAGWSDRDAVQHPEWRAVNKDGTDQVTGGFEYGKAYGAPKKYGAWQTLCLNDGQYAEHIYKTAEEVCRRYEKLDGLFFDICIIGDVCYCDDCKRGIKELGMNVNNEDDVRKYFIIKRQAFMQKCTDILKKYHPDATIFFNSGGADQYKPDFHAYQTHFEMEDLPTAWGGYDKLPLRAKFFEGTGKSYIGMTGKFHLDWGEFGGFKSKEALKYEVSAMALYGAGCSVGDHMHPDGEMELQTYENIGYAYEYLKKIAPYCYGGESTANVGVYLSPDKDANEGISSILVENHIDYDVIRDNNFRKFDTVILPEKTVLDSEELAALRDYLDHNGKLIFMADALVENGKFQIDCGLEYLGSAKYDCDYLVTSVKDTLVPNAPMLCNIPGHRVKAAEETQILAEKLEPYFSRTYARFCGHKNTPHNKSTEKTPAIVQCGNIVYLAHSLPRQYYVFGSPYHKNYFMLALQAVYAGGKITADGLYAQGRCTMIQQREQNRYCINMIYASPIRRGCAEIIEDIVPLYNIHVTAQISEKISRVYLPLTGESLVYSVEDKQVSFTVPELNCHTTVVIEYV